MAVKIRLRRMGTKGKPFYRMVVADGRSPRDGRFIDLLGYYDPRTKPPTLKIDGEKALLWLSRGAQPSDTAEALLKKEAVTEKFLAAREKKAKKEPVAEKPSAVKEKTEKEPVAEKPSAVKEKTEKEPVAEKPSPAKEKKARKEPVVVEPDSAVAETEAEPKKPAPKRRKATATSTKRKSTSTEPEAAADSEAANEEQSSEEQG